MLSINSFNKCSTECRVPTTLLEKKGIAVNKIDEKKFPPSYLTK